MHKHYFSDDHENGCICNQQIGGGATQVFKEVTCYKCKDILSRIPGNKFYEKQLADIRRVERVEGAKAEERDKEQRIKKIRDLKGKKRDLEHTQIEIIRKYRKRPTPNVHLNDIEYKKIEKELIEIQEELERIE